MPLTLRRTRILISIGSLIPLILVVTTSEAFQVVRPTSGLQKFLTPSDKSSVLTLFASTGGSQEGDDVPSMDWLTDSVKNERRKDQKTSSSSIEVDESQYIEEFEADDDLGDVPIPTTGVSVADEMQDMSKDLFATEVFPIEELVEQGIQVAQLITTASTGVFEPVRYLIGLSKDDDDSKAKESAQKDYVMVDLPPYSETLEQELRSFMGPDGRLSAILVTTKEAIHYDDSPSVFTFRNSDFQKWTEAFEGLEIVAYRLDIPRDCRDFITQRLDGYGPFALEEDRQTGNMTFIETGRPLTYVEWGEEVAKGVMTRGETPPDDLEDGETAADDAEKYSPEAIRRREEGKRILAIYTPGRSFGTMSYVFPELQACLSGFTIPIEDTRSDENVGMDSAGPMLDVRGYITTSKAGIVRQMESARNLINTYVDRFDVVLTSRGDVLVLESDVEARKRELLGVIDQYDRIGKIYEQLGITSEDNDVNT